jgi:hypothetical protein
MSTQMENDNFATVMVNLRTKMNELLSLGIATPEGFGLYQQTIMQLLQEFEKRKQSCFSQAQQLKTQAAAVESQGHAFSACGSVVFNIVSGYIELEQKRIREEQERKAEAAATPEASVEPPKKTWSRKKKVPDVAGASEVTASPLEASASPPEASATPPEVVPDASADHQS